MTAATHSALVDAGLDGGGHAGAIVDQATSAVEEVVTETAPGEVAAAVMSAAATQWPALPVADLSSIHAWAIEHAHHGESVLTGHLSKPTGSSDPRVHVVLRLAAPIAATGPGEVPATTAAPVSGVPATGAAITCQVPHDLITDHRVSDAALQLWMLFGTLPPLNREHRPVMWWWLAERGGEQWAGLSEATVKKRMRRGAAELAAAGALSVLTEQLGGGRSRSLYRRLRQPAKSRFEIVSLRNVRTLSPQLLRAYLRWLKVMGHRRHTRQALSALAMAWGVSRMNARRQRDDLVEAGLLEVRDGVVAVPGQESVTHTPDSASDSSYPQAPETGGEGGTFSSGGWNNLVRPYKEKKNKKELHPFGTLVPSTQVGREPFADADPASDHSQDRAQPSPLAAPPPTEEPEPDSTAAAAVQTTRSPSKRASTTEWGEAGSIVAGVRWLAIAPGRVRGQVRTVLAGLLKVLPDQLTTGDVKRAIETIDPGEPTTEHVRLVRAAVSGLHADLKAQTPTAPHPRPRLVRLADPKEVDPAEGEPDPGCAVPGSLADTGEQASDRDPLEAFRSAPSEISWTDPDLSEPDVFDWLCVLYVRHLDAHGPGVIPRLRTIVQRQVPTQWNETAAAAAHTIAALATPKAAG